MLTHSRPLAVHSCAYGCASKAQCTSHKCHVKRWTHHDEITLETWNWELQLWVFWMPMAWWPLHFVISVRLGGPHTSINAKPCMQLIGAAWQLHIKLSSGVCNMENGCPTFDCCAAFFLIFFLCCCSQELSQIETRNAELAWAPTSELFSGPVR